MITVTLSTKYQVVIPKDVRQYLCLHPGKKYQVVPYGECIELIPLRRAKNMHGVFKGTDRPTRD